MNIYQSVLGKFSAKYRVNVKEVFDGIYDMEYVMVKFDSPKIHDNFPKQYKIGSDLDIYTTPEFVYKIKNKILEVNLNKKLKAKIIQSDKNIRIRYQFCNISNLLFDINIYDQENNTFWHDSIKKHRLLKGIKTPEMKYELVVRAKTYIENTNKKYHLSFIKEHKNEIDFNLMNKQGINQSFLTQFKIK
ncbi:hypothetical protein N1F78_00245 [Seonamhaeicola sp. MEBiC1930]|uniref:hypothetical protein n=1 Tax=Seonamhaeicola sp. MEBiC01930 TaxID=2976768 RepID=UPI0032500AAD